jgi:hypothetical protein
MKCVFFNNILPPYSPTLHRRILPLTLFGMTDVILRAQEKGWMTEELMLEWLKIVWGRRP